MECPRRENPHQPWKMNDGDQFKSIVSSMIYHNKTSDVPEVLDSMTHGGKIDNNTQNENHLSWKSSSSKLLAEVFIRMF